MTTTDRPPEASFLAIDWGTTNLRAWIIGADGVVLAEQRLPWGVGKLSPGEAARRLEESVRPTLGAQDLPAVLCGMVGSALGIVEVAYLDCPAGLDDLARGMAEIPGQVPAARIVPGLRCRRADGDPDVMRGEETKVLGWTCLDPARRQGLRLLCLPGTHPKWVVVEDGRIVRFVTAMSGELFALLTRHSVLRSEESDSRDDAAFLEGVRRGQAAGPLAAKLFSVRSRVVGGAMAPGLARDYLSGLLIGDETAFLPEMAGCGAIRAVDVVGEPGLCRLYAQALAERGVETLVHSGDEAVIAGLVALYRKTSDDA